MSPGLAGESGIEIGNRDVSHLLLLPSLFFVRLEYFIERLFKGFSDFLVSQTLLQNHVALPCCPQGS